MLMLQINCDCVVFFFSDFIGCQDVLDIGGVDCNWFFYENVFVCFDGGFEMKWVKVGRCCQNYYIDVVFQDFFVSIEFDKLVFLWNVYFVVVFVFDGVIGFLKLIGEEIVYCD